MKEKLRASLERRENLAKQLEHELSLGETARPIKERELLALGAASWVTEGARICGKAKWLLVWTRCTLHGVLS